MNTLVVNPGSTGTKYKIFNQDGLAIKDVQFPLSDLMGQQTFLVNLGHISKIIIRVVHGGDVTEPCEINNKTRDIIKKYLDFAPIHNQRALDVIDFLQELFSDVPMFAYFDTAFHTTIPEHLKAYAIPTALAKENHLKKYGFHGIAVESSLQKLREVLHNKLPEKIICLHLGGGCSVTAVRKGESYATSMGLTPLSGIMMTTRSGDIDPDIVNILSHRKGMSPQEVSNLLNNHSGFLGITGSSDTLYIFTEAQRGIQPYKYAFDMFVSDIVQKIYAYAGLMQGLDAVVFTGGIGYGNQYLRDTVTKKLTMLGIGHDKVYPIDIDEEQIMFHRVQG